MDEKILPAAEVAEYTEFKRRRREAEAALTMKRMIVDASRRETDKFALKSALSLTAKTGANGVLVSPVNVSAARRQLRAGARVVCLVGGTGESLPVIKKKEAKKAISGGAGEIRLVPCYSALIGGNLTYLKREIKKVRKTVRRGALILSLEDHTLGEEQIALGVRAACEGGADGVCVRGELALILRAVQCAAGRVYVDCSGVENVEQLRDALRAGAAHVTTKFAAEIREEFSDLIHLSSAPFPESPSASFPDSPSASFPDSPSDLSPASRNLSPTSHS